MEQLTIKELIEQLRSRLVPFNPNYPMVKIKYEHNAGYVDAKHVTDAIDVLEKRLRVAATGVDEFTALERLALWVLIDSANIE